MKSKIIFPLAIIFLSAKIFSQDYKTGLGVRLSPYFNCIDAKHFFGEKLAIEGMLNIVPTQSTLVVLAEFANDFAKQPGLKWYYGLGGAMRFPNNSPIVVSIDGILGLEYTFSGAPINLSLDWKPAIEIINGNISHPSGFGIAIRYVFK